VTAALQAAFCCALSMPLQMVSGALWPEHETAYMRLGREGAGGGGTVSAAPTSARSQWVTHVCSSTGSKMHGSSLRSGHSPPAARVESAQTLTRQCQQE
jgi:hypothetical protein